MAHPRAERRAPDPDAAYASALAVRARRIARGEPPRGFKLGFTLRALAHCVTTLPACPDPTSIWAMW